MDACLNSSVRMDWQTPDTLLELVRQVGPIIFDPCTTPDNPTGAARFRTPDMPGGGREVAWWPYSEQGLTFVNPPYGRELAKWVAKCVQESLRNVEIVLLTPARPDTRWFQSVARPTLVLPQPTVLFWRGRLKFKGAKDAAPFPSALFYWGPRHERFREVFAGRGLFL